MPSSDLMDQGERFPKNQEATSIEREVAGLRARGDDLTFRVKHMRNRVSFGSWWVVVDFVNRTTGVPEQVTLKQCDTASAANQIVAALREHESQRQGDAGE
jgi:hypothetical protein